MLETAIVYPGRSPSAPIVVLVHGGGFNSSANANMEVLSAKKLQADGFVVFDANYSDSAGGAFPLQRNEVMAATIYARANAEAYNADPTRVTLLGGSSSGLTVSLAAQELDNARLPVQHVITLSAPFYFPSLIKHWTSLNSKEGAVHLDNIFGALNCNAATCTPAMERMWSPLGRVNFKTRATSWLLINGTNELMPRQEADAMASDLATFRVPVTEDVFPDSAHSFRYFDAVRGEIDEFAARRS
jgi:acetyl esterase/lipase